MCAYLQDAELEIDLPCPTILKPERMWTGKQIFNLLMRPSKSNPVNVNLECKNKTSEKPSTEHDFSYPPFMSRNDGYLVVQNSEIICGVFDKATVGDGNKKSVFAVIQRDFGEDAAAKCMNRMAKLCARWLGELPLSPTSARILFADSALADSQRTRDSRSVSATSHLENNFDGRRIRSYSRLTPLPTSTFDSLPKTDSSVNPVRTWNKPSNR
jgi:hypothetical protein